MITGSTKPIFFSSAWVAQEKEPIALRENPPFLDLRLRAQVDEGPPDRSPPPECPKERPLPVSAREPEQASLPLFSRNLPFLRFPLFLYLEKNNEYQTPQHGKSESPDKEPQTIHTGAQEPIPHARRLRVFLPRSRFFINPFCFSQADHGRPSYQALKHLHKALKIRSYQILPKRRPDWAQTLKRRLNQAVKTRSHQAPSHQTLKERRLRSHQILKEPRTSSITISGLDENQTS